MHVILRITRYYLSYIAIIQRNTLKKVWQVKYAIELLLHRNGFVFTHNIRLLNALKSKSTVC